VASLTKNDRESTLEGKPYNPCKERGLSRKQSVDNK
jgi:hypothetical protein